MQRKTCGKTGSNECLLFHSGLRSKSTSHIVKVTHFISLVCSKGNGDFLICLRNKCLHLHICGGHKCAGYSMEIDAFVTLIDMVSLQRGRSPIGCN